MVGWEKTSYHVYEDTPHGVVEVCATVYTADNVKCPIPFPFNIMMTTLGPNTGNAVLLNSEACSHFFISGDHPISSTIRFGPCNKRQCVNVSDENLKRNESISITLERTSDLDSRIILTPVDARITLVNDESMRMSLLT